MRLEKRIYSVLVVSAAENFNSVIKELLPEANFYPVAFCASITSAKRALAEREYDFVIINAPLPDDIGARFAIDTCKSTSSSVLILVKADSHAEIREKVYTHGVFTLPKPTSKPTITMAIGWMSSTRERMRGFEKKTLSIEEKMEEIRFVNRAKWLLISELHMDEPEAHRYIEKQAMDRCVSKKIIAEEIIKTYS